MSNKEQFFFPKSDVPLRSVQLVELDILKAVDKICRKYNIPYMLYGGTMLGAIRHRGFIPWDDDIDICMLRNDYERFLEIASHELPDHLVLSNYKYEKYSTLMFTKVRHLDSLFAHPANLDSPVHHGIFIDIFPLDSLQSNYRKSKKQMLKSNRQFIIVSSLDKNRCKYSSSIKNSLMRLFIYYFTKIIPKARIFKRAERVFQQFNATNTDFVTSFTNGGTPDAIDRIKIERSSFSDLVDMTFENHLFLMPRNYDEILRRFYGDYMKYPPIENRQPLHGVSDIRLPKGY
ncbi:MAG TPA: LicD family protein [Bacillota bacterium]|nr:LicD family protein [Bacillota bacterium]